MRAAKKLKRARAKTQKSIKPGGPVFRSYNGQWAIASQLGRVRRHYRVQLNILNARHCFELEATLRQCREISEFKVD